MNQLKLLQYHSMSGWILFIVHVLAIALPGSALKPAPARIKAASRTAFRNVRDVSFSQQTQCFVSCLDAACPGTIIFPGSTTTSTTTTTTTGTGTTTTTDTTTTGTGTTTTTDTTTTGTGTTTTTDTTTSDTMTATTSNGPDCTVSVSPNQAFYSPTECSEIILYGSVSDCTTVFYKSTSVRFVLEGLLSPCFEATTHNDYSYYDRFPAIVIFTPVQYNTILCDVGQGLRYSGNVTAIDNSQHPSKRLMTWSITVDTSGLEHCIGTYVSPLYTGCYGTGCNYFSNLTARYELSGFESCSAMQFIDGILFFDVANGKSCNITSAQRHQGVLKAFNSYNVEYLSSGAWAMWDITLLTGGVQPCPPIWDGSITTTITTTSTSTTTGLLKVVKVTNVLAISHGGSPGAAACYGLMSAVCMMQSCDKYALWTLQSAAAMVTYARQSSPRYRTLNFIQRLNQISSEA